MRSSFSPRGTCRTLVAGAAALMLVACGETGLSSAELVTQARTAYEQGQTKMAVLSLKEALSVNPDDPDARRLLAQLYLDEGEGSAAEIEIDKAEALGVSSQELVLMRLQSLMLQDKFDKVLDLDWNAESASGDPAERARILAIRGIASAALGRENDAQAAYDEALALDPNCGEALVGKAQRELARNQIDAGLQFAMQASERAPRYAPGWSLLGDIQQFKGALPDAEAAYTKAIGLRVQNAEDLLNRVIIRLASDNREGAAADIETLRKRGFNDPHGAFARGLYELGARNFAAASEQFQAVVSKHGNFVRATCYLGLSQAALGNYNRAVNDLQRCIKTYPNAAAIRRTLAATQMALQQPDEAKRTLSPLFSSESPDAATLELLASQKLAEQDPGQAIEYLRKAVASETATASSYLKLGIALAATGATDAADAFAEAAELDPQIKRTDLLEATTLLRANNVESARKRVERILNERPDDVQALNLLAICEARAGDEDKARDAWRKALKLSPDYTIAALNLASSLVRAPAYEDALALVDGVLKREPGHMRALSMAIALDIKLGSVERARQRLAAVPDNGTSSTDTLLLEARLEKAIGNLEAAGKIYAKLLEREGDLSPLMREYSEVLLQSGQSEKALVVLKKLVSRSDVLPMDHLLKARAYELLGDYRNARSAVSDALAAAPDYPAARMAEIRLLLREGKASEARSRYEDLSALAPATPLAEMLETEGLLLMLENKRGEALKKYEAALEREPSTARALALARAHAAVQDADGAIRVLEQWQEAHPDDQSARFVLADVYAKTGKQEKAVATYEALLAGQPENALALNNLAWLLRDDNPGKALELAKKAVAAAPDAAAMLDTLGMLQLSAGSTEEAVVTLRKAQERAPDNGPIRVHLAQALTRHGAPEEARRLLRGLQEGGLDATQVKQLAALKLELGM